jgi:hypothetical protein
MASTIPSGSWPYRKVQRPSANLFAMLGARIAKGETTDDVFGFLTAGLPPGVSMKTCAGM